MKETITTSVFNIIRIVPKNSDVKRRMIWLHGWGHSHANLMNLAEFFDDFADNYVFDLPGFGASPIPKEVWGTEDYADAVANWIKNLPNDKENILIGHSFGCRVSVQFANKYPELVKAICLISPAGLKKKRSLYFKARSMLIKYFAKLLGLFDKFLKTQHRTKFSMKFGSRDYINAGEMRSIFVKTISEDLSDVAAKIQTPTAIIVGDKDNETPVEFGERYNKLIKNSELFVFPSIDHYSIISGARHQTINVIKKFINNLTD